MTLQKNKASWEITTSNYMPKNGQAGKNGQILRKSQPSETEPGRNRKYKQTKHKHWNWDCD